HLGLGLDRRGARRAVQQAHLTEELSQALTVQELLDARLDDLRDEHGAASNEEHLVAGVALAEEHLVLLEGPLAQALRERHQIRLGERREQSDLAQEREEIDGRRHRRGPAPEGDTRRMSALWNSWRRWWACVLASACSP